MKLYKSESVTLIVRHLVRMVRVELDSVREMVRLLSNATNNINQIAHRANSTGSIYAADIDELSGRYEEIWGQIKTILRKLSSL